MAISQGSEVIKSTDEVDLLVFIFSAEVGYTNIFDHLVHYIVSTDCMRLLH